MKVILSTFFFVLILSTAAQNRDHAFEINQKLGRGINFGNMFEAPSEIAWGNQWQPDYPRMIAEQGFNHVRIPVRWEPADRSSANPPYTVYPVFLNRIKQVVDSCLNNGLFAIINMHHHEALFADPDSQKARFLAQWKQISQFFKDYPDQLLFEILNEPNGKLTPEKWNIFLVDALSAIRQDNPNRVVLIGTPEWGGLGGLSKLQLPTDQNIIVTVHYYNPFTFTHQGAEWSEGSTAWLGTKWNDTETERQVIQSEFAPLKTMEEQQKIPVHVGEFGAYYKANATSRKKWTTYLARYFETQGWSWAYWEFSAGFGIYNPGTTSWNQYLVDALLHNPMPQPAYYTGTPVYTSAFAQTVSDWNLSFYSAGGASGTKQSSAGQLHVQINNKGTAGWHIQLAKTGIALKAGKKYRVTIKARAAAQRDITAYTGMNRANWTAYSDYNTLSLTTTTKEYTYVFDMKSDDSDARIVFDIGLSDVDVYFESIVLESVELQEPSSSRIMDGRHSKIYPNPVGNHLTIFNADHFDRADFLNLNGERIMSKKLNDFENKIDVSPFVSGTYFVCLTKLDQRITHKIIKK